MREQADRLLELGFQEEVAELVKSCPVGRQTLLFSATMNTKVDDLASLALNKVGVNDCCVHISAGLGQTQEENVTAEFGECSGALLVCIGTAAKYQGVFLLTAAGCSRGVDVFVRGRHFLIIKKKGQDSEARADRGSHHWCAPLYVVWRRWWLILSVRQTCAFRAASTFSSVSMSAPSSNAESPQLLKIAHTLRRHNDLINPPPPVHYLNSSLSPPLRELNLNHDNMQPVRVRASPMNSAPQRLVQEFVRIRQSREQDREAILLSLLSRLVMSGDGQCGC